MVLGCFHVYSTTDLGLGDWDILTVLFEISERNYGFGHDRQVLH